MLPSESADHEKIWCVEYDVLPIYKVTKLGIFKHHGYHWSKMFWISLYSQIVSSYALCEYGHTTGYMMEIIDMKGNGCG